MPRPYICLDGGRSPTVREGVIVARPFIVRWWGRSPTVREGVVVARPLIVRWWGRSPTVRKGVMLARSAIARLPCPSITYSIAFATSRSFQKNLVISMPRPWLYSFG